MPGRPVCKDRHGCQNDSENQRATARGKNAPRDFVHTLAPGDHKRGDNAPASRRTPKRFTRNFERHLQLQRSVSHRNRILFVLRKTDINGKLVQFAWWALATIVFALIVAIRIRLLGIPLERDEGEYAYAGQLILQGIPPYKLAYNMKFPGTYAAYALIMSLFGQTISGIHLGLLLVNTATSALIFLLGRHLMNNSTAGIAA